MNARQSLFGGVENLAVTVAVPSASIDATVSGAKVTVHPVGAFADGVTSVTGAVPVLVMTSSMLVGVPALAVVERTWLEVETSSE